MLRNKKYCKEKSRGFTEKSRDTNRNEFHILSKIRLTLITDTLTITQEMKTHKTKNLNGRGDQQ
jgi:hypothetical protein